MFIFRKFVPSIGCRSILSRSPLHTTRYICAAAEPPNPEEFPPERVRNFSIIAHIDHGKSTLADRLLERAGTISASSSNKQVLDKLKVERDRGITVKAQTASLVYAYQGQRYLLNLVDTPGHVDFSYEVSRSLAACQGIILVVDASQGIQAQTIANFYLAFSQDLKVVPVLNKIDLPHADVDKVKAQLKDVLELDPNEMICVSAKSGLNIDHIFPAIIERIPPPSARLDRPLRALLFDSWYDDYKGVICLLAVLDGRLRKGDIITSAHTGRQYDVSELGIMYPECTERKAIQAGQVGYVITSMKNTKEAHIGDVFHDPAHPAQPLQGFKASKSMVFAGVYPLDGSEFEKLQSSLNKLTLNDASVSVARETSVALGQGFRLGFLGMLHLDVFRQRLEEDYGTNVIITSPCVPYQVTYEDGSIKIVDNPADFPARDSKVALIQEPFISSTIMMPDTYLGPIIALCEKRRGIKGETNYLNDGRLMLSYRLPLSEVAENHFFNELKQLTSGYASFDYEESQYEASDIVKMDINLNGTPVDALARLIHRSTATSMARHMAQKMREVVDRQQFDVAIQVCVDGKSVARETLKSYRKDVTAKCYGRDVTRKRKLLDKQKEGKKRMRTIGKIELSHDAFLSLIKR